MSRLVWFRNDLRVRDNQVLTKACQVGDRVIGAYCFDPRHYEESDFGFKKTEKFRARFLLETIQELRGNLQKINVPLFLFQQRPEDCLPQLIRDQAISEVFMQEEWTSEETNVFKKLQKNCPGTVFHQFYDQFLFHPDDLPFPTLQRLPEVFTTFRKKCEAACTVRDELPVPKPRPKDHFMEGTGALPSLQDLGLEEFEMDPRTAFPFKGGEDQAWARIQDYFFDSKRLATYKQTRNGMVGKDYSSKLSPWLANGSISTRSIYHQVHRFEDTIRKNEDTYWMIFELIWRDFFKYISLKHGNKIFLLGGILDREYTWSRDKRTLQQWCEGRTKYDLVNANMIEMASTGFMSNRGRQNVASFWAKEQKMDWRIGAAYFESVLIDYDVHSNWGNWMYSAGVGNDPRDRKFNIPKQTSDYDRDGSYRRLWLQSQTGRNSTKTNRP